MPGLRSASGAVQTLRFGRAWARLGPWAVDPGVARLVTSSDAPLDTDAVARCTHRAAESGYRGVVTSALTDRETLPFLELGFAVHEQLHLLTAEVTGELTAQRDGRPVAAPGSVVTRVRRREHDAVLALDAASFASDWRLGRAGLRDALSATPERQFRASRDPRTDAITGYAITGVAGSHGYLQRLATDPAHRRAGIGRALVLDAFAYLWRHGARRASVNTQHHNVAALALYRSCGFELEPTGLHVLERAL
jgi:ribosomal protein S18 acetylase RimI-like enzyme